MNATRIKWQLPHFANLLAALISFLPRLQAQIAVPPLVTYHGRLSASGTNYVGTGYFKFAIVNGGTNLNRSAGGYCVTAGGGVSSAVVTDGGSGYTVVPQVTILAPPGSPGAGATAIAAMAGGVVTSVTIQTPGSNYWGGVFLAIAPPPIVYGYTTYWSGNGQLDENGQPTAPLALTVSAGLFQVVLGDAPTAYLPPEIFQHGDAQLRIWFSPTEAGPFQELTPPQRLTATPYAMVAAQAASVQGSNVVGSLPVTTLTDALGAPLWLTNNANFLAGNAAAIFNLNAGSLASGTVPDVRLSPNVALLNGNQTFTGQNTFQNPGDTGGSIRIGANAADASPKLVYFGNSNAVSIGESGAPNRMELRADNFALLGNNNEGNVGINKTNPVATLDVNGTVAANNFSGSFTGNGNALSNLNGGQIVSGSISSGQLAAGAAAANLAAEGQSAVPSGGMILSEDPTNSALANAGYVKIGKLELIPEAWQTNYASGPPDTGNLNQARGGHTAVWTGSEMLIWGGYNGSYLGDGYRYNPVANTWTALSHINAPGPRSGHCAVWTGSKMIVWGGSDSSGGLYAPATDVWSGMSTVNAPAGYTSSAYAWTGTSFLTWGGTGEAYDGGNPGGYMWTTVYGTGGRYNPATDTWTVVTANKAPSPRFNAAFAWTGSELVVWGGKFTEYDVADPFGGDWVKSYHTGARYNPTADSWITMATNGAPDVRHSATAVWTGSQVLIWGGIGSVLTNGFWGDYYADINLNTGARYSPAGNSWSSITTANAPLARSGHTAIWAGGRMTIWGGFGDTGGLNTGGRYDPVANTWTTTTTASAPLARGGHRAVWTGTQMLVWGGQNNPNYPSLWFDAGSRYNITNDTWTSVAATPSSGDPGARQRATAVWTGSEMVIWGGESAGYYLHSGGRFNPALNAWSASSLNGAPSGRILHTAVWTGSAMLIWGGFDQAPTATGARYYPATDSWLQINKTNAPAARSRHTAVWTGTEMIVWGGVTNGLISPYVNTGGRYNPFRNAWTATLTNAPLVGRADHTAVWTGSEMIVWGGVSSTLPAYPAYHNSGARFSPATDSWLSLPAYLSPTARAYHTAIWTGTEMVVWGGYNGSALNTGGRFNPSSGWSGVPVNNAPTARYNHTAVWDGSQMIVWGGTSDGTNGITRGARFLPRTGDWTATAWLGPVILPDRINYCAVWTGTEMLIWGGKKYSYGGNTSYRNDTFGYAPQRITYLYTRP